MTEAERIEAILAEHEPVLGVFAGKAGIVGCSCLSARDYRAFGYVGGQVGYRAHLRAALVAAETGGGWTFWTEDGPCTLRSWCGITGAHGHDPSGTVRFTTPCMTAETGGLAEVWGIQQPPNVHVERDYPERRWADQQMKYAPEGSILVRRFVTEWEPALLVPDQQTSEGSER